MSSSSVTESPVWVIRHKTPLLVPPATVPHPQVGPVADRTVASAIQFAPFVEVVGGGVGVAIDVGVGVACVGMRTSEHAGESRISVRSRSSDFMASLPSR